MLNLMFNGHSYAFPLIATNSGISNVAPGDQAIFLALSSLLVCLLSVPASLFLSLRAMAILSQVIGIAGTVLFAWSGQIQQRTPLQEAIFYVAQVSPFACCIFGFITCNQLAADLYPARVASTSVGLIMGAGSAGSVVASYIFAMFEHWPGFYLFLSALCAVSLLASMTVLSFTPWKDQALEEALEDTPFTGHNKS